MRRLEQFVAKIRAEMIADARLTTANGCESSGRVGRDGRVRGDDGRTDAAKRAEVDASIREHPDWTNVQVAEQCKVSRDLVRKRREAIGVGPPVAVAGAGDGCRRSGGIGSDNRVRGDDGRTDAAKRTEVDACILEHLDWTNVQVAAQCGVDKSLNGGAWVTTGRRRSPPHSMPRRRRR